MDLNEYFGIILGSLALILFIELPFNNVRALLLDENQLKKMNWKRRIDAHSGGGNELNAMKCLSSTATKPYDLIWHSINLKSKQVNYNQIEKPL